VRLDQSPTATPVAAVLGYSIDEALASYRPVAITWAVVLALGLAIGVAGALMIARGVSRPVELLAKTAKRIEGGDYQPPPPLQRRDEIGQLSAAFANMAQAIGEREDRIRFQSSHDLATGLLNRFAAEFEIEEALASSGSGALLAVGLTRLPEIVKTMGHGLADRLMNHAAQSLRRLAAEGSVARIGDASLSVWLSGATPSNAAVLAAALVDTLREPYREADLAIDVSPAVGIALGPQHGAAASKLMQRAEVALFAATGTHDGVAVYDPATDPHRTERLTLMGDLLQGIELGQLRLNYQPKVNLETRLIDGAEGLVRWHHPVRGMVPPDAFIGLAEETGNIRRLTRWVLAAAAAQERAWHARGWKMKLAVNVSARDLADADLPRRMDDLLAEHGLAAHRILLEITESAVMDEPDLAIQVLKSLADRGIDLAIDDFGVGQSSLAYLRRLPVRELKIDQTFVRKLSLDREDQTIVRSIVELGHHLGYRVTAEGVEDEGAFEYLASIGCDHAQGYFIARPMPAADFDQFARAARWPVETAEAVA
jgi:predicted signal transduction protein with EAL and GGDEF domain